MVGVIANPKIVAYSIPLNAVISKSVCNPGRKSTAASSNVPAAKAPMLHRFVENFKFTSERSLRQVKP